MIDVWRYDSQSEQAIVAQTVDNRRNLAIVKNVSLQKLKEWFAKGIPGNVVRKEYLESQLPEQYKKHKNLYLKKAGVNGPIFTRDGEYIYTICEYDPTGEKQSIIIKHDKLIGRQR